jgi:Family of unknown function (DUF6665)
MINLKARAQMLGRTEMELRSEMAASLGRIGRILTETIETLKSGDSGDQSHKYRELYAKAKLYYWYLIVQREAIGIRNHDCLKELYPMPNLKLG